MSKHEVSFIAKEPIVGGIEIELDPQLTDELKKDEAINEVEYAHPELEDIEITFIKEVE